jgi:16S rRNA processing protein RimM
LEILEEGLKSIYCGPSEDRLETFSIEEYRQHGDGALLLKMEGLDSPEAVKTRSRWGLYSAMGGISPEGEGDIFWVSELLGMSVYDVDSGNMVGQIVSCYERPGQDLIGIDFRGTEILCPLVDPLVPKIDRKRREVFVQWTVVGPLSS